MRGFIGGIVTTLLVVFGGVYLVHSFGWFPVGADNPPGTLERRLANTVTGSYLAKHAPDAQAAWQAAAGLAPKSE